MFRKKKSLLVSCPHNKSVVMGSFNQGQTHDETQKHVNHTEVNPWVAYLILAFVQQFLSPGEEGKANSQLFS